MKSLCKNTDHELIHSFMDGDMNALETLVVRHKDKLYTSILFMVKDKYLADDIFQDIILHYRGLRSAVLITNLAGFAAKIYYYTLTLS